MPHFRIHIKLKYEPVQEYLIENDRKFIDVIYADYKPRANEKNVVGLVVDSPAVRMCAVARV